MAKMAMGRAHFSYSDEFVLQELLINGMQISKIASLIFHVSRNRG
jgi:hypothetical protein